MILPATSEPNFRPEFDGTVSLVAMFAGIVDAGQVLSAATVVNDQTKSLSRRCRPDPSPPRSRGDGRRIVFVGDSREEGVSVATLVLALQLTVAATPVLVLTRSITHPRGDETG